MSRLGLVITMALAMLFACAGVVLAQSQDPDDGQAPVGEEFLEDTAGLDAGDPIPGKYIVVLEERVENPDAVADDLAGELGLETTNVYDALEGFAAEVPAGELPELRSDPRVDFIAQDRVVEAAAQARPTGIRRIKADLSSTAAGDGSGTVDEDIAILDTGINAQHADLNVAGGLNCVGGDPNNYSDGDGHGTHVAGTAAATDNDIGVVGGAPGARLWAVKVLADDGFGSFDSIICGINWVTARNMDVDTSNDIEVANMSLGARLPGSDDRNCGWTADDLSADAAGTALHQAVCDSVAAGTFYAVAAGNDSRSFARDVPAAFDEVLTVTAMVDYNGKPTVKKSSTCSRDKDETAANFSNFTGIRNPDKAHTIAAPGVCINSTWKNGGYKTLSGTSMASPHVAGTAALCIANGDCPRNDPEGTRTQLRSDAAARPDSYGYQGDPNDRIRKRYYGYLEYAGAY